MPDKEVGIKWSKKQAFSVNEACSNTHSHGEKFVAPWRRVRRPPHRLRRRIPRSGCQWSAKQSRGDEIHYVHRKKTLKMQSHCPLGINKSEKINPDSFSRKVLAGKIIHSFSRRWDVEKTNVFRPIDGRKKEEKKRKRESIRQFVMLHCCMSVF